MYLGEVLLRNGLANKGYKWIVPEEIKDEQTLKALDYPNNVNPLLCDSNNYITPIDKVRKYWDNGEEDNLLSFCEYILSNI